MTAAQLPKEEYLLEASLEKFMRDRIDQNIIRNKTIPQALDKSRPDFRSERHMLIVEFDSPRHYQDPTSVLNDNQKDQERTALGYTSIRIPYFIQIDQIVIRHLFEKYTTDYTDFMDFRHGFIDPKAPLPAQFCELGVARFRRDLQHFSCISEDILQSLAEAEIRLGDWRHVYPPSMMQELSRNAEEISAPCPSSR